jgi:hypothetical protein
MATISANHVITVAAPTAANQQVTITGITIQKGNTSVTTSSTTINGLAYSKTNGGGIIIGKAVLELNKCIITDNTWMGRRRRNLCLYKRYSDS